MEKSNSSSSIEQGAAFSHICGSDVVLCNPADILSSIFQCHNHGDDGEDPPRLVPADPATTLATTRLGDGVVKVNDNNSSSSSSNSNFTPPTSPIRRGRFLVWPVSLSAAPSSPTGY
jgi:hypothetical protein